ncbi:hypothetical protein C1I98_35985 [Spongiactinospora gelatinilytica]|uniref:HTH arsR-type domain-containing protein n=1 Tax=Spongiactinospora gelatinilytica TaxID=2666298 RepID=A0A2W2GB41_9ACTN|nr:helix-turn-helix domain-containing protein [Spongiactinospora gelatinilytica]PZG24004.1 hypothetical protein C1I98_35985 [Spongiactinospora gelatinilytica]
MSPRVVPDEEPIWRALADPTRRAILDVLRGGARSTGALAAVFPTTRFAVMKHLGVLADAGLITIERRGRERLNHLNPVPLRMAYERWVRPLAGITAHPVETAGAAEGPEPSRGARVEYGLDVRAEHTVKAGAERTWGALLDLADWWPRTWPEGERLAFEPRLGGRLGTTAEGRTLDDGPGTLWGVVSALSPGRELVLDGSMGVRGPVAGQWRMILTPEGETTSVIVEHRVIGEIDEDTRAGFTLAWPGTLAALDSYLSGLCGRNDSQPVFPERNYGA